MAREELPDPGLPIKLEPCSNGEFMPLPASPLVRRTIETANRVVDDRSKRLGVSRREFLQSSLGVTTMMAVLAACASDEGQTGGTFLPESSDASVAPPTSADQESDLTMEEEAADDALAAGQDEFVFDVQGLSLIHI